MNVVNISAFHTVTEVSANSEQQIVSPTNKNSIKTVQSIFLKAPKASDSEFIIKTGISGRRHEIMNVLVSMNSTKVINVQQQLPEYTSMSATASAGGIVTANGVEATLGE